MRAALFLFGVVSYGAFFTALLYAGAVGLGVLAPAHAFPIVQAAVYAFTLFVVVAALSGSVAHPAIRTWSARLVPAALALMLAVWMSQPVQSAMVDLSGLA